MFTVQPLPDIDSEYGSGSTQLKIGRRRQIRLIYKNHRPNSELSYNAIFCVVLKKILLKNIFFETVFSRFITLPGVHIRIRIRIQI